MTMKIREIAARARANWRLKVLIGALVAFAIFVLFPTAGPRPEHVGNANRMYLALINFDNTLNAWPSLHAAFAILHGACCHVIFRPGDRSGAIRLFIWVWVICILASTLLIKQYVISDLAAGVALGLGGYVLLRRAVADDVAMEAKT